MEGVSRMLSREGLCDFGRPGVRRPERRAVLVDHLYLFCWHNGWSITKRRLRKFNYRQLIGMLNRLARGEGSWMFDALLSEQGLHVVRHGLPMGDVPENRQLKLGLETKETTPRPSRPTRRTA